MQPYVIVVGDPSMERKSYTYDKDTCVLKLGCYDNYDELSHKIAFGINAIVELFNPEYIFKIDDDVVVNPDLFISSLDTLRVNQYCGYMLYKDCGYSSDWGIARYVKPENKLPAYIPQGSHCTGPMYLLGKESISVLKLHMNPDSLKFEDVNVGATLAKHGIEAVRVNMYTDHIAEFKSNRYIAFHDAQHVMEQNEL